MLSGGRTKISDLLASTAPGTDVVVKGWVRTKRGNKNVAFIAMNDGSTIHNIQIVADVAAFDEPLLKSITTGSCLKVTGTLVEYDSDSPQEVAEHILSCALEYEQRNPSDDMTVLALGLWKR